MTPAFPCWAALSARRANDAVRNLRAWLPQTRWFCRSLTSGQPEGASSPQPRGRYLGQPAPHTHPHLLQPGEVMPGFTREEFALRRHRLMAAVQAESPGSVVLVPSNPTCIMTNDIPYPFHQHSDLLYLTGFQEPDSLLLLLPRRGGATAATHKAVLLVPPRDATRELWDGPRSGPDGAVALTGVDEAFPLQELARVLAHAGEPPAWWYYPHGDPPHPEMHERHVGPMLAPAAAQGRVRSLRKHVAALRLVKSQAEVRVMGAAAEITAQAMVETMRASSPPVDEAFLYAKFEFECRARGAEILAYPPVVAGGNRANILHYVKNNQIIQDGEMVLLDGGCELHGYASDVTRTWPVSGCFSGPQAELYEAVLDVQKLCLRGCRAGSTMEGLYSLMLLQLGQRLQELGILGGDLSPGAAAKAARQYCPHHVGHYLGMDVHDTPDVSRSIALQPGMAITIEPGLYIPRADESVPVRFRGLGVRVEDDVVITEAEPLVLSSSCPKERRHIEDIVAK
ncbi:xaa-Pro aminopeptidase 3 isoform X1 [Petromyzon marinus]|uniref:xaa-Pro aminopeptidase 3 isoform X1 n=1 Tax=Petromyzon marinus TaxID=7757 RepID=UPI003F70DA84